MLPCRNPARIAIVGCGGGSFSALRWTSDGRVLSLFLPPEEGTVIIVGIGSDLANIDRIARTIERFGARFLNRVYTETEQALAERRRERVATYAKRWAAKEACSKALGTGLRMGIKWRDMGVVNLRTGQPTMVLTGWAEARLRTLTPAGHRAHVHLTLTDDHPWAMAVVVIETLAET